MTRHESREQAFILVFEHEFSDLTYDEIIETAQESRDMKCSKFCRALIDGVGAHGEAVDNAIRNHMKGWSFSRLSKVALAVLRIGVYELLFADETPDNVAANEAVELAKYYGGKEDASYVNGVISGIIRAKKDGKTVEEIAAPKAEIAEPAEGEVE